MRFYLPSPVLLLLSFSPLLVSSCQFVGTENTAQPVFTAYAESDDFADYWYAGEAELNTYKIRQSRYGEEREGEAIMVFVTEDFSNSKQVKLDNPAGAGKDKIPVLKLNHIRRFITGVHDYSMMQSVFTPVDLKVHNKTLKTTTSSQDWCGHTFMQLNLDGDKYQASGFSYFETEGDKIRKMDAALLEDELWTRLRIAPESIPTGTVDIIPSTFFSRLLHKEMSPKQARIQIEKGKELSHLVLEYLHLDRTLRIGFEPEFPHKIVGWKEEMDGRLASSGKLKATLNSSYWQQHGNSDEYLRDSLRLQ